MWLLLLITSDRLSSAGRKRHSLPSARTFPINLHAGIQDYTGVWRGSWCLTKRTRGRGFLLHCTFELRQKESVYAVLQFALVRALCVCHLHQFTQALDCNWTLRTVRGLCSICIRLSWQCKESTLTDSHYKSSELSNCCSLLENCSWSIHIVWLTYFWP